jgi:hypothetical protein
VKELYLLIAQRLREKLPETGHIDLFNRQFDRLETGHPVAYPAILIDMQAEFAGKGKGKQDGAWTITMHIGQELYADTYMGSDSQIKAFEVLDFVDKVYLALQGFEGERLSPLERTALEPDSDHDNLVVYKISFMGNLLDDSKAEAAAYIKLSPELKLSKNIIPD